MLYLQWGGEIKHILGYLDGAKQLLTELKKIPRNIACIDLFNFGVIIQNDYGYLGYNTSIMKFNYCRQGDRIDNAVCWDNGNYIIDFDNLTIVGREIVTYSNDESNMAKSIANVVVLDSDEIAKEINDARENDKEAIAEVAKSIYEKNLSIFG